MALRRSRVPVLAFLASLGLVACAGAPHRSDGSPGFPASASARPRGGAHGARILNGSAKEGGLDFTVPIDYRKLPNGLEVIMVEDHTVPIVSYQSWFRVGSVDEQPGKTGLSHLFEHLMFKGTPRYPAKQFFMQLEAKGAEVNAFTTRDYTVYHEDFVPELLEKVIDMESDRMANLVLDQPTLDTERGVVLEERKLRTENVPEGRMQEALWELAYRIHPYRWPVIGYPRDVMSIQLDELLDYFHEHYQPANLAVVVVGDIDADATFALIRKYYEPIPSRPRPERKPPEEPPQNEERRLVMHDQVASERVLQGYHITSAEQDDSYALDVLSNILFEGTSSRAYRRLVEEKDIALGVSGTSFTPAYPGLFIISATMKSGVPASKAEAELETLIQDAQDREVTPDEIAIAVKQLTVQVVDGVRTPHGLAQLIGTVQTILGSPYRITDDLEKYLKVTAADVRRVAQTYLVPNNRSVITLTPGGAR